MIFFVGLIPTFNLHRHLKAMLNFDLGKGCIFSFTLRNLQIFPDCIRFLYENILSLSF